MNTLQGKIAVITGATRGLGKATAQLFVREGAKVIAAGRSKLNLEKIANDLSNEGHSCSVITCDVSDLKQLEHLAKYAIQTYGGLDIWINNAGIAGPYGATFDLSTDQFISVLNTNIIGCYYGSLTAMRYFLEHKSGKLINILGAGSRRPVPNQNAYGSSKSWIRVFTMALAAEYRQSGVGVFTFQPGLMNTDLLTKLITFKQHEKRLRDFMPFLIRAGVKPPEMAAQKLLWLVSSRTDGKTGLDVRVGSRFAILPGFLREGVRSLLRLPVPKVDIHVEVIPSAFQSFDNEGENHLYS